MQPTRALGQPAVAIGVAEVVDGQFAPGACAVIAPCGNQYVFCFRAIAASVHGQSTPDGARNTSVELQPGQPGLGRGTGDSGIKRRRSRHDPVALNLNAREGAPGKPDHHTRDATITDDHVGADTQHSYRDRIRQALEETREIVVIRREEQYICRASNPEPGEGAQRLVAQQFAAHWRQGVAPVCHADRTSSSPGKA